MNRSYNYRLTATISDTNMEGNVYWTRFCEWFGKARELFLISLLPDGVNVAEFLKSQRIAIITCDVYMKFLKPVYFTDRIVVKINTDNFGKCSVVIVVTIVNEDTEEVVAIGRQKLAFTDTETKEFVPIPSLLKEAAIAYEATKTPLGVNSRKELVAK